MIMLQTTLTVILLIVAIIVAIGVYRLCRFKRKENEKVKKEYYDLYENYKKLETERCNLWKEKESLHSKYCDLLERNNALEKDYLTSLQFASISEYKEMIRTITDMYERQHGCHISKIFVLEDLNSVVRRKKILVLM